MSDLNPQANFSTIVALIQERRLRVTRLVNRELIDLYWEIGKYLDERIDTDGWGKGTVHQLAEHLLGYETGLRGFSASNLWRMRQFYQTWRSAPEELATLLRELQWSAHVDLLGRCGTDAEREFYLRYAVRENHSVRDLRRAIDTATFERVALADEKLATVSRVFPRSPATTSRTATSSSSWACPLPTPRPISGTPWSIVSGNFCGSLAVISPSSVKNIPSRSAIGTDRSTCCFSTEG